MCILSSFSVAGAKMAPAFFYVIVISYSPDA